MGADVKRAAAIVLLLGCACHAVHAVPPHDGHDSEADTFLQTLLRHGTAARPQAGHQPAADAVRSTRLSSTFRLLHSQLAYDSPLWRREHMRRTQQRRQPQHNDGPHSQAHRSRRSAACPIQAVRDACPVPGCEWTFDTDIPDNDRPILKCNASCATAALRNADCSYPAECQPPEVELTYTGRARTYDAQETCFKLALQHLPASADVLIVQREDAAADMAARVDALVAARSDAQFSVLFLYDLGLTRVPSATLQRVSATLTYLDLSSNRIRSINGSDFAALTQLATLFLSRNELRDLGNATFAHNPELGTLLLNNNDIAALPPHFLGQHVKVQQLNLAYNRLISLPDDIFPPGSNVDSVSLTSNRLTAIPAAVLRLNATLAFLSLANNAIAAFPSGTASLRLNFTATFLDLEMTNLQALPPAWAQELQQRCRALNMANNPLQSLTFASEGRMRLINVAQTRVSRLAFPTEMESIDVSENPQLQQLNITGTVDTVDVSGTMISADQIDCRRHGVKELHVRDMRHASWYAPAVLAGCMGGTNQREILDVSGLRGLSQIGAIRATFAGLRYSMNAPADLANRSDGGYIYFFNSSYTWYNVAPPLTHLLMIGSPTQCKYEQTQSQLIFSRRGLNFSPQYQVAVAEHRCRCTAGYQESDGVCQPKEPWVAHPGIQALISVLSIAAVLVIVVVLYRYFGKQKKALKQDREEVYERFKLQEQKTKRLEGAWKIDAGDVALERLIDSGQFGEVHRGRWRGFDVAVKVLSATMMELDESSIEGFKTEADFLTFARHANLITFFGAGELRSKDGRERPFLVLELAERGSLSGILRAMEKEGNSLGQRLAIQLAVDVCSAMHFIHTTLRGVHQDLKTANVLITADWCGKVADFGSIAKVLNENEGERKREQQRHRSALFEGNDVCSTAWTVVETTASLASGPQYTVEYAPPEVLAGDANPAEAKAADVWSFGVVLWEMVEIKEPDLLQMHNCQAGGPYSSRQAALLHRGLRHTFTPGAPRWARDLYVQCTKARPDERPTFKELLDILGRTQPVDEETSAA